MKIVDRKTFLKMENVIFSKYESCGIITTPKIMHGHSASVDFIFSELFGDLKTKNSTDFHVQFSMLEYGESIQMSVEETSRDGLFEEDEKYLIYEKDKNEKVVSVLNEIIERVKR